MAPVNYGIWGKPTSTLDWCEENYIVTQFVAEFCEFKFILLICFLYLHHKFRVGTERNQITRRPYGFHILAVFSICLKSQLNMNELQTEVESSNVALQCVFFCLHLFRYLGIGYYIISYL